MTHTSVLARVATTGIYLLRGIPRDLQQVARTRAAKDGTTLGAVLLQGLREYAAGSTPQIHDRSAAPETHVEAPGATDMKKSAKASSRVTAPDREASAAVAESKTASRRKAVRSNAVENVAGRQLQKTQAAAIQGHLRASGQRRQAKRDAR